MGSRHKKKEKKKDFTKQRLKVGKTKPKNDNFTDTSFKAKSIYVPKQSVLSNPDSVKELEKNISLTRHKTPQVRKDAVIYIAKHLSEHPTLTKSCITSMSKLITDQARSVRLECYNGLRQMPVLSIQLNCNLIILYVQSAMTHIDMSIRNDSTRFLLVLTEKQCLDYLVNNHWVKLIKCFFSLLNWRLNDKNSGVNLGMNNDSNAKIRHLQVLETIVTYGCKQETENHTEFAAVHELSKHYLLPTIPNPYTHLKLFQRSLKAQEPQAADYIDRRQILIADYSQVMLNELSSIIKQGGEIGRVAKTLEASVTEIISQEQTYKYNIGIRKDTHLSTISGKIESKISSNSV